ncbi:hypothetical protein D9M73_258760 [compost metagenome]
MATCKKCNEEFRSELHYDSETGDQKIECPKCGAKHTARKLPTLPGAPAQYEVKLADNSWYDRGNG